MGFPLHFGYSMSILTGFYSHVEQTIKANTIFTADPFGISGW
jgi:hypothetical protein